MIWRVLFVLLLVGNLLGVAGWAGWLDSWLPLQSQSWRVAEQLAPERLQVMPQGKSASTGAKTADTAAPGESASAGGAQADPAAGNPAPVPSVPVASAAAPAASAASAPSATPAAAPTTPAAPAAATAAPAAVAAPATAAATAGGAPTAPKTALSCVETGPIDEARLESLRAWAKSPGEGLQASLETRAEPRSYMIYLPPAGSTAEAQRRIEQLRQKKVDDLFLIVEGPLRNAISLGIFRTQESVQARQQELAARGVTGTRIAPGRTVERRFMKLRQVESQAASSWSEAVARLQSLSGAGTTGCR